MKRKTLLAIALAAVAALPSAAGAAVQPPTVPGTIAPGAGHKPFLLAHATGVQIYSCRSGAWVLLAPRATLYGDNGQAIADHYGGPTWQARDGSRVVGKRVDGVPGAPGAIPWLLLSADSTSAGPDGDRLEGTTYIQRVATVGGVSPAASECVTEGEQVEIPYTADYVFWKAAS